jgi:hypothetical protein
MIVSWIALRVIRREGEDFAVTIQMVNRTAHLLGLHESLAGPGTEGFPDGIARRHFDGRAPTFEEAERRANKTPREMLRGPLGVRDCFQILFFFAFVFFVGFLVFASWAWVSSVGPVAPTTP